MPEDQLTTDDEKLRGSIATKVLKYGSVVLAIIAFIIIIAGIILLVVAHNDDKGTERALTLITGIFYALLPVIATWVGTVIAFYFGKANFEIASKNVDALVKHITSSDEKLQSIQISEPGVMRLFDNINYNKEIVSKKDSEINLVNDLIGCVDKNKSGDRLPIFNDKKILRYIIHESTMNEFVRKFISGKYPALKDKKLEEISLDQVINNTDDDFMTKITKSATFVAKNATLFDANQKLINNPLCQDVFITETGNENEAVIGWITNNKIAELAKV